MCTPVSINSHLKKTTGSGDGMISGDEIRVSCHYGPRVRSEPKDIIRPDMSAWRTSSVDDEQPANQYGFSMRWADKIAKRLRRPIEEAAVFDGDDGYNSGLDGDNDENKLSVPQREYHFDHIFQMDEDYDFVPENLPLASQQPVQQQSFEDNSEEFFPEHFFTNPVVLNRPLKRSVPYSVEEYQELTSHGRCRRSANRHVDPKELRSLYQRVRDYVNTRKAVARRVPDLPLNSPLAIDRPRTPLVSSLDAVIEEGDGWKKESTGNEVDDTYGGRYFRRRLAEKERRGRMGILRNNLFEVDPTIVSVGSFDPRPSTPIDTTPEPMNQFLFDEQELN